MAVAIIGIEGYDILSVSLASPGFAEGWGLNTETLGLVLAMETFGAAAGSLLFSRLANLVGRRSVIVWGLGLMTIIMALSATATNVVALACWSLLTGLCIGGTTPSLVTLVSEVASDRRRDLAATLLGFGYSLGLIVGVAAVAFILHLRWPWVFALGCVLTGIAFLLALFFVPETIPFLERRRPANALARINTLREKFGPKIGLTRYVYVADTDEEALRRGEAALRYHRANLLKLANEAGYTIASPVIPPDNIAQAVREGWAAAGSPATVREQIAAIAEQVDINYFVFAPLMADLPLEWGLRTLDIFRDEIIPAFSEEGIAVLPSSRDIAAM